MKNNFRTIALLGSVVGSLLLSGCTAMTREALIRTGSRDSVSLKHTYKDKSFSDPMQLMYSISWAKPVHGNNLDNFNAFKYTNPNATQDALQAGAIATSLLSGNPLSALTNATVIQINKSTPSQLYRQNLLITMVPISSDSSSPTEAIEKDAKISVTELYARTTKMIETAYAKNNSPVIMDVVDTDFKSGQDTRFEPHYLVPKNPSYCPQNIESIEQLNRSELKYCTTLVKKYVALAYNNDSVSLAINGNYAIMLTFLPDMFPIEYLSSEDKYTYLFVPSFFYRMSDIGRQLNGSMLAKLYKQGRFSLNPYVKNLKTGEYMYFNENVSKLQQNKFARVDEERVISNSK